MNIDELSDALESNIQTTADYVQEGGLTFLVYGAPGVGKTYLCRTADGDMLLASAESGVASLSDVDIDMVELDENSPEKALKQLDSIYKYLDEADHDYEWAGLDSISEISEIILKREKEKHKDNRQAYGELAERVKTMMRKFRSLDVNVYFSAKQCRTQTDDGMMYMPSFPGNQLKNKSPVAHDFDNVLSLQIREDEQDNLHRALLTERLRGYEAKVRDPEGRVSRWEPADLGQLRKKLLGLHEE